MLFNITAHRGPPAAEAAQHTSRVLYEAQSYVYGALMWLATRVPKPVAVGINHLAAWGGFSAPKWRTGPAHEVQVVPFQIPRHVEMEMAVPGPQCSAMLGRVLDGMERLRVYTGFVLEVRFSRRDSNWLSTGYGVDASEECVSLDAAHQRQLCAAMCHVTVGMFYPEPALLREYFSLVERIALQHGGRPHWAKRFYSGPAALQAALPKYGAWWQLRNQWDPDSVFVNAWLAQLRPVSTAV